MDRFIAYVQAGLTLLIVGAWVLLLVLTAVGTVQDADYADRMKEVVMLAVGFWLLRPRASNGAGKADEEPKPPKPAPAPAVAPVTYTTS
jgi:hypothetical protein